MLYLIPRFYPSGAIPFTGSLLQFAYISDECKNRMICAGSGIFVNFLNFLFRPVCQPSHSKNISFPGT